MHTHRASCLVDADVDSVLAVVTDPALIEQWFPLPLRLFDHDGQPLQPGRTYRAKGKLGGRDLQVALAVEQADADGVKMTAEGPLAFGLDARCVAYGNRSKIEATITCRSGGGLSGKLFAAAAGPLLGPGSERALASIARMAASRQRSAA
jgi:uncharacterized protein YndB with AHSA1/START domain